MISKAIEQVVDDALMKVTRWMARQHGLVLIMILAVPVAISMFAAAFFETANSRALVVFLMCSFQFLFTAMAMGGAIEEGMRWRLAKYGMSRESLSQIRWRDFERFMEVFFRLEGYEVERRGGPQPDGGIDLIVRKNGKRSVVQCKQWNLDQVGVDVIRGTLGARELEGTEGAIVATTGFFTEKARETAERRMDLLELIDGADISNRLKAKEKEIDEQTGEGAAREEVIRIVKLMKEEISRIGETIPIHRCSKCGGRMVLIYSTKNRDRFWGCGNFGTERCIGETIPLSIIEREILGR